MIPLQNLTELLKKKGTIGDGIYQGGPTPSVGSIRAKLSPVMKFTGRLTIDYVGYLKFGSICIG